MTSIWHEILPVTLESGHVVLLRRREDDAAHTWLVLHQAGRHPNEIVLEHIERFFGEVFEPDRSIIHSTSWRYCPSTDRLILTYLVILPQRTWKCCQAESHRLVAQYIGKGETARGDNLRPPARIETDNILAHALDHLALLKYTDASIKGILEAGWLHALATRFPKPAGYVPQACFE
jgi:hypothetical protein